LLFYLICLGCAPDLSQHLHEAAIGSDSPISAANLRKKISSLRDAIYPILTLVRFKLRFPEIDQRVRLPQLRANGAINR